MYEIDMTKKASALSYVFRGSSVHRAAILSIASRICPSPYSTNISKNNIDEQNNIIEDHASKVNNNVKIELNFFQEGSLESITSRT